MENHIEMTAETAFLMLYKHRKSKEMHLTSLYVPNICKNQSQALQQVNFLEKLLGQELKSGPNKAILTYEHSVFPEFFTLKAMLSPT